LTNLFVTKFISRLIFCYKIILANRIGTGTWVEWTDDQCSQPPTIPSPVFPIDGAFTFARPTFCLLNSYAGGCTNPLTYDLQIASDPLMQNIIFESNGNPEEEIYTCISIPSGSAQNLQENQTYYWQTRAFNGQISTGWSEIQFFHITENACGDINLDQSANISDVVCIINFVFFLAPLPDLGVNSDTNCDNNINVSDAVHLINYIFLSGNIPCDMNNDLLPDC